MGMCVYICVCVEFCMCVCLCVRVEDHLLSLFFILFNEADLSVKLSSNYRARDLPSKLGVHADCHTHPTVYLLLVRQVL